MAEESLRNTLEKVKKSRTRSSRAELEQQSILALELYSEGKSFEEIALATGISQTRFKNILLDAITDGRTEIKIPGYKCGKKSSLPKWLLVFFPDVDDLLIKATPHKDGVLLETINIKDI